MSRTNEASASMRIGVLVSGGGSNLQALIDAAAVPGGLGAATIAVVGSNVPDCGGLSRAEKAGIPTFAIDHRLYKERAAFDAALKTALDEHKVELVVLAGFMRVLGGAFLGAFPDRVVNIHPALLPAFPGIHGQKQAFDYGVKIAGCTVHFVDAGVDTGPVIAQAAVAFHDDDDEERLRLRILEQEHYLLPQVVRALAEGRVRRVGRRVFVSKDQVSTHEPSPVEPLRSL